MMFERKNNRVFSIGNLMLQISEWSKENGYKLPSVISLPIEEYVYLAWFRELDKKYPDEIPFDSFLGISLEVNRDKQTVSFGY